jgi:hypothetical protein
MSDFAFGSAVNRREKEMIARRNIVKSEHERTLAERRIASIRTSEIVEQAESSRKEQALRDELARKIEAGASDNGVKIERYLEISYNTKNPESDKVILPFSLLNELSSDSRVVYPLLFELLCESSGRRTHCGVLEFSSNEGEIGLPLKVMTCLQTNIGGKVRLRYKVLPKGTAVSLKVPLSMFAMFPDFRAFLESSLQRQYGTLTVGDTIPVGLVEKLEPEPAVCIIDADITVDLSIIDDTDKGQKWTVGSSRSVSGQSQSRLWIKSLSGDKTLRITANTSKVDIFVSFPPLLEASESSFDLVELGETTENSTEVLISHSDLILHQNPEFITVGVRSLSSASEAILINTSVIDANPVILDSSSTSSPENTVICENCGKQIALSSITLHKLRCEASVKFCMECKKSVRLQDFSDHMHCTECGRSYQRTKENEHRLNWHSTIVCLCGKSVTRNTMRVHRSTSCTNRLVLCRWCGCYFPIGNLGSMDARDRIMGFTSEHEAACGNRTEPCLICNRRERLKDMQFHMQAYHPD